MLTYLFQVTLCLAAFYLLYVVFLSKETFFRINRAYLMGTLLLSVCIPLMLLLSGGLISPGQDITFVNTLEPIAIGLHEAGASLSASVEPDSHLLLSVLSLLYWAVVLILLFRFGRNLFAIRRMYRAGDQQPLTHHTRLVLSSESHPPFSFFNLIFLSKQHALSDEELDEILTHESAHAAALHSLDVLLVEVACILLWPSPFIYLYRKSLRRVHEYLADAAVLGRTSFKEYGQLLISQAMHHTQLPLANHFFQSQLKHRFIMMTKSKSHRVAIFKYVAIIPLAFFILILFAFRESGTFQENGTTGFSAVPDSIPGTTVYKVVEEMPRFPGCEETDLKGDELFNCAQRKMLEHIYKEISYPKEAKDNNIMGRAVAQFIVRSDGSIDNIRIVRSLGYGTDEEVMRTISTMPTWRPGYHEGTPVDVEFTLPISFRFNSDAVEEHAEAPVVVTTSSEVFKVVEEMPRFPGCEDSGLEGEALQKCAFEKLIGFMQEHMRYPAEAKKANIEGNTIAQFIVKADGSITDAKIIRSIGYGTEEVVLEIVSAMPAWRPGYEGGKAVDVQMTLPVSFKLPKETKENSTTETSKSTLRIEAFPVPSDDQLNYEITVPPGSGVIHVALLNENGQVIQQDKMSLKLSEEGVYIENFNIKNTAPGAYVIRAQWGDQVVTKAVVIQ